MKKIGNFLPHSNQENLKVKKIELSKLEYPYDSLESYIDEKTMEIHHDKHHQTYVDKFNALIEANKELEGRTPKEIIMDIEDVDEKIRTAVRNHGGGVINHNFLWKILKKNTEPKGNILKEIEKEFGNIDKFKEEFKKSAMSLFGSGWTWLVLDDGKLNIINTSNQDSPLSMGMIPLLTIDLWEHAYYLKYQNRRADYIDNFFHVINWEKVNEIFLEENVNG
ncbi:MAG: superoxide dismutase [Candidatus Pacearchaeota archaeon]